MVLIPKAGFIKERPIRKQSLQHGGQAGSSEWSSTCQVNRCREPADYDYELVAAAAAAASEKGEGEGQGGGDAPAAAAGRLCGTHRLLGMVPVIRRRTDI
mmetsp:Transcript_12869/g.17912  ORF Transcript_12869/g.17912 Transcript_12869/m.17912 type:complete len:100 (+) Transcript_12869:3-302(+)